MLDLQLRANFARSFWLRIAVASCAVACLARANPSSESLIAWSDTKVTQTLYPGAHTSVTVTFQSSKSLELLELSFSPGPQEAIRVAPSTIPVIVPGSSYSVTLTFSALPSINKITHGSVLLSAVNPKTGQKVLLDGAALPVALRVDASVKQDFSSLANALESENFDTQLGKILSRFAPSERERAREVLKTLDRVTRVHQAEAFRSAQLFYGIEDYQVYRSQWTEQGGRRAVEFSLALIDGEWLIVSW